MSHFEYITVFLSIVIALAVAEVLVGLGRLIRDRQNVKIYWVHIAWMLLAILVLISSWWSVWDIREYEFRGYFDFLVLLLPHMMLVVVAFLLSPPIESSRNLDLREYYFKQIRWIAHLVAAQLTLMAFSRILMGADELFAPINAVRVVIVLTFLFLGFSTNERLHGAAAMVVSGLFGLTVVSKLFGAS